MFFTVGQLLGYLFPVFLIAMGLWMLARSRGREQAERAREASAATYGRRPRATLPDQTMPPGMPPSGLPVSPPSVTEHSRVSATPEPGKDAKKRYNKFIGDMFVDCSGVDLQNTEVSSFIGDVEIKLHGGKLAPGLNRMIISGFIGDVRVLVPEGMAVFAQCSNFVGDIEMMGKRSSGFGNSLDAQTPNYGEADGKLYIASNHFIGDVRVYIV